MFSAIGAPVIEAEIAGLVARIMDEEKRKITALRTSVIDECIAAIRVQQASFASSEYAVGQPLSSFQERFACGRCIEELEKLK